MSEKLELELVEWLESDSQHRFKEFRDQLNYLFGSKVKTDKCKIAHVLSRKKSITEAAIGVKKLFDDYRREECDHVSYLHYVVILQ